jgi:hypothetical protein
LALAAIPNLVTESAVYALRAQRRTAAGALIFAAVAVLTLGMSVVLLPSIGIVGVGVACLVAESVVSLVLLRRLDWWLPTSKERTATASLPSWAGRLGPTVVAPRTPTPARSHVTSDVPSRHSSEVSPSLPGTLGLIVVATGLLVAGTLQHARPTILLSLAFSALSIMPLAKFYCATRRAMPDADGALPTTAGQPASPVPIENYDELRIDEVLPLLQELDVDQLRAVRAYEVTGRARRSILTRTDLLVDAVEE